MNLLLFSAGGTSFRLWKSSEIQIKCYLIFIWLCWCWSDERECERPRCLSLPDDFEGKLTRFSAGGTSFRRGKYWNAITTPRIGRAGRRLWTLGRAGGFIIFFKTKEIFTKFPIFLNKKKIAKICSANFDEISVYESIDLKARCFFCRLALSSFHSMAQRRPR